MKTFLKLKYFISLVLISTQYICFGSVAKVFVYDQYNTSYSQNIKKIFNTLNVPFEEVKDLNIDVENLYVIFNVNTISAAELPKNYIAYQTVDLNSTALSLDYLQKLTNAIAVWDYSRVNIKKYGSSIYHYYHFPVDYQYADPVILPCLLPVSTLKSYKELLTDSNREDSDISSHLPAMFYYTIVQNPKLIVEAGVRGGNSTRSFDAAINYCNAEIIGIDFDSSWKNIYAKVKNSTFWCINDLDFLHHYQASRFNQTKIDIAFIDTSHQYQHTMGEISIFVPLLNKNGILMFHDSNVTPLNNGTGYVRLNETYGSAGGNPRGVTEALKNYFSISFNEHAYCNFTFSKNGSTWHMIHYPFCNGLTIVKKID